MQQETDRDGVSLVLPGKEATKRRTGRWQTDNRATKQGGRPIHATLTRSDAGQRGGACHTKVCDATPGARAPKACGERAKEAVAAWGAQRMPIARVRRGVARDPRDPTPTPPPAGGWCA